MLYSIQLVTHNDRGLVLLESKEAASYRGAVHCARRWANAYGQNTGTIRVIDTRRMRVVWTYSAAYGRQFVPLYAGTRADIFRDMRALGVTSPEKMRACLEMFSELPAVRNLP